MRTQADRDSPAHGLGSRRATAIAAVLLVGVVLARLAHVSRADEGILGHRFNDDGYYNLTIGRRLAGGLGFTFEGPTSSSGFHPPVVLLAAAGFGIFGDDNVAVFRTLLVVHAAAAALLGWLVYRITRRLSGGGTALAALLLYATAETLERQTVNACDTVFAGIALALTVWFYIARVRPVPSPSFRRLAGLGLLAGGMGLVRLDLLVFAAAMVVDFIVVRMRRRALEPKRVVTLAAAAGLGVAPVLVLNLALTGRAIPDNARAVPLISRATAGLEVSLGEHGLLRSLGGGFTDYVETGARAYPDDRPPPAFHTTVLRHAGLALLDVVPHTGAGTMLGRLGIRALTAAGLDGPARVFREWGGGLALAVLLGVLYLGLALVRARSFPELRTFAPVAFLLPACLILVLAYALVIHGQWYYSRYFFPVGLVTLLFTGAFARLLTRRWTPRRVGILAAALLSISVLSRLPEWTRPEPSLAYRQARRLAAFLPERAVLGAFQAGHFAFFCPQTVINLDGRTDPDARRALAERRVLEYARERGVQFVCDWPPLVRLMMIERSAPEARDALTRIDPPPDARFPTNENGFATWALRPPATGRGPGDDRGR